MKVTDKQVVVVRDVKDSELDMLASLGVDSSPEATSDSYLLVRTEHLLQAADSEVPQTDEEKDESLYGADTIEAAREALKKVSPVAAGSLFVLFIAERVAV